MRHYEKEWVFKKISGTVHGGQHRRQDPDIYPGAGCGKGQQWLAGLQQSSPVQHPKDVG